MFTLTIKTDNAAFEGDPANEVARILLAAAAKLLHGGTSFNLTDINGNKVGSCELENEAEDDAVEEDAVWHSGGYLNDPQLEEG
jgi:hypothetical protein